MVIGPGAEVAAAGSQPTAGIEPAWLGTVSDSQVAAGIGCDDAGVAADVCGLLEPAGQDTAPLGNDDIDPVSNMAL